MYTEDGAVVRIFPTQGGGLIGFQSPLEGAAMSVEPRQMV